MAEFRDSISTATVAQREFPRVVRWIAYDSET
jgi:hypothetical protein